MPTQLIADGIYNIKGGQFDKFCSTNYDNYKINCQVNIATELEQFRLTHLSDNYYYIKAPTNMYCRASGGANYIECKYSKDNTVLHELPFKISDAGNGYYYIKGGFGGLYFCSDDVNFICDRQIAGPSEKFKIIPYVEPTTPAPTTSAPSTSAATTPAATTRAPTRQVQSTPISIPPCSAYDVEDPNSLYDVLNTTDPSIYNHMMECLQQQIIEKNAPLVQLANNYGDNKLEAISASEQKLNTDIIYKDNMFYTTSKIFMFILLIAAYIYFFKDSGIFQPIKDGVQMITTQLDKVKDIKMPKIKMPEVTMPSIKMPTK